DSRLDCDPVNSAWAFPGGGRMRKAIGIIAFALVWGSAALAADPDLNGRSSAPAAQAVNWTGFYFGANAGGVIAHTSGTSDFTDTSSVFTNPQTNVFSRAVFLGGVQAGYNLQVSSIWVAGVEADWDWSGTKYNFCRQTSPASVACSDSNRGFETIGSNTECLGTFPR